MTQKLKLKLNFWNRLIDNCSCTSLIRFLNYYPTFGGFPLQTDKIAVKVMVFIISLQFYVFVVGTVAYHIYIAEGFLDYVISFLNIFIFGVVIISTLWFLFQKKEINEYIVLALKNDNLLLNSNRCVDKYKKLLGKIKIIIMTCYLCHVINDIIIYIPSRIFYMENFAVVSCVGFDLTSSPSHEICMFLLASQELTAHVMVASYDSFVLFMFTHTTAIFQILYEDMSSFTEITNNLHISEEMSAIISDRLRNIIKRHTVLLSTVDKMQQAFTVSIGSGFIQNALTLCLFFVLPLEVSLNFWPLIYYTIFVFFLYCYYGQMLTNASEKFEMAVYLCGWEKLDVKDQRFILMILMQTQKPVVLKAAKVIPISINTFANAMQSIYKFVTVFKL